MRPTPAALLLAATLAAGCGGPDSGAPDGVLEIAVAAPPRSFDPVDAGSTIDMVIQRQVLETLVEYDPESPPQGVQGLLAESWTTSADGLSWEFTLRDDASFHDPRQGAGLWAAGTRPVVASDVVYSWERIRDPALDADGNWAMEPIATIEAVDARRVRVGLVRPDATLLQRLATASFAVVPHELAEAEGRSFRDTPVGSGPYLLAGWTPGQEAAFARVEDWRGQLGIEGRPVASIPELRIAYVREAATRTHLFESGRIARLSPAQDAHARLLPDGELAPELAASGVRLHRAAIPDLTMLVFQMRDPAVGEIAGDAEGNARRQLLRRALAAAFPRNGWHQVVRVGDSADPARGFLPPQLPEAGGLAAFPWAGGADQAMELLAQAGWPRGEGAPQLRFEIGGSDPVTRAYGDLVVSAWRSLGLDVELVVHGDFGALQSAALRGEVMTMIRAWSLDWPDASLMFDAFDGAQAGQFANLSNFRSRAFDARLAEFRIADAASRATLAAELCAILDSTVPAMPIDHRGGFLLLQPWLLDFRLHPFDPYACKFWRLAEDR